MSEQTFTASEVKIIHFFYLQFGSRVERSDSRIIRFTIIIRIAIRRIIRVIGIIAYRIVARILTVSRSCVDHATGIQISLCNRMRSRTRHALPR